MYTFSPQSFNQSILCLSSTKTDSTENALCGNCLWVYLMRDCPLDMPIILIDAMNKINIIPQLNCRYVQHHKLACTRHVYIPTITISLIMHTYIHTIIALIRNRLHNSTIKHILVHFKPLHVQNAKQQFVNLLQYSIF